MEPYGVALIVAGIAVAYFLGLKTAEYFADKAETEKKDALERQYLRIKANTDFYDPVGPYQFPKANYRKQKGFSPAQLTEFEARLKNNGSAVVQLNSQPHTDDKK